MTALREVIWGLRGTSTSLSGQIASLRDLALIGGDVVVRVNRQRFDLLALLHEAVDEFQGSQGRHHVVRFDAQVSTLDGEWDRQLVERVAANLLSNAHKYSSPESEIQVSVWSELAADGEWAAFSVKDQGIGIPASDLSRVFTPYERASNVGDTAGQGIGLASVWEIAQLHGGGVEIQSQVGSGTTVTVRLPVAASS